MTANRPKIRLSFDTKFKIATYAAQHKDRLQKLTLVAITAEIKKQFGIDLITSPQQLRVMLAQAGIQPPKRGGARTKSLLTRARVKVLTETIAHLYEALGQAVPEEFRLMKEDMERDPAMIDKSQTQS